MITESGGYRATGVDAVQGTIAKTNKPSSAGSISFSFLLVLEHLPIFQISGFPVERVWVSPCMKVSFCLTTLLFSGSDTWPIIQLQPH